jgi:hypothetical protein
MCHNFSEKLEKIRGFQRNEILSLEKLIHRKKGIIEFDYNCTSWITPYF